MNRSSWEVRFVVREIPGPEPAADEVLIKVHAAAVAPHRFSQDQINDALRLVARGVDFSRETRIDGDVALIAVASYSGRGLPSRHGPRGEYRAASRSHATGLRGGYPRETLRAGALCEEIYSRRRTGSWQALEHE